MNKNFMSRFIITVLLLVFAETSYAQTYLRSWSAYLLPGVSCGNGDPYKIFVSPGAADKVTIAFEGGGACWSYDSCFGLIKTTSLKAPLNMIETQGIYSLDPRKSPVYDSTMVFFPYCTGDVFAGTHTATYKNNKVYHIGNDVVIAGLNYLMKNMWPIFKTATDMTVYGASAGAIGALVHVRDVDSAFGHIPHKHLILDSPGLHFGPKFWHKFTPELVADYSAAISSAGFMFDYNDGLIAGVVPALCHDLNDWRIGVMQSTRDRVMSFIFGEISSSAHEALVLGPNGIFELTKDIDDNCSAWVPSSGQHTFIDGGKAGPLAGGVFAVNYAYEVVGSSLMKNYK